VRDHKSFMGQAEDEHHGPRPHVIACSGCWRERKCHICGTILDRGNRCTSGACPKCCASDHFHPQNH